MMDNALFLQHLHDLSLEEGRAYIQEHIAELTDYDAIGNLLADEALAKLYDPFVSLNLAELLIFFGEVTHHMPWVSRPKGTFCFKLDIIKHV